MSNAAGFRSPKVYSECIESGNMSRLRAGAWLSDDIMAFYTGLILKRNSEDDKLPDIHYFNTFFYTKLSTQGYSGLRRWTKKVGRSDFTSEPSSRMLIACRSTCSPRTWCWFL